MFDDDAERLHFLSERAAAKAPPADVIITQAARERMEREKLPLDRVLALGKNVIKAADLDALAGGRADRSRPVGPEVSKQQRAVARVVERSHATIPRAFLLMRVWCDRLQTELRRLGGQDSAPIGVTEILVKTIAGLAGQFPFFFRRGRSETDAFGVSDPNIGVTVDRGRGLYIPVVHSPSSLSLAQIAEVIWGYRMKAQRGGFLQSELEGGHITITLNAEPDTVFSLPIILPEQTSMVCVGPIEKWFDGRAVVHLGLAYDHRFINGFDASRFLTAIKKRLEQPEHVDTAPPLLPSGVKEDGDDGEGPGDVG